jgi:hypothetical protein
MNKNEMRVHTKMLGDWVAGYAEKGIEYFLNVEDGKITLTAWRDDNCFIVENFDSIETFKNWCYNNDVKFGSFVTYVSDEEIGEER